MQAGVTPQHLELAIGTKPVPHVRRIGGYAGHASGIRNRGRTTLDRGALIQALRTDQAGKSTFPEFLAASWRAGVVRYDVDFAARTVSYYGSNGEEYVEAYPAVDVK